MKNLWMLVLMTGFVASLAIIPAAAQNSTQLVSFQAPATFYAGNAKLPPGGYTISQMSAQNGDVCVITSSSGQHSVLLNCRHSSKSPTGNAPQVLFNRYGNTDYLEGVLATQDRSVDFIEETAEKLAAKTGTPQAHSVKAK